MAYGLKFANLARLDEGTEIRTLQCDIWPEKNPPKIGLAIPPGFAVYRRRLVKENSLIVRYGAIFDFIELV